MQTSSITYPAGALLRVGEICRDAKTGRPGLLPINRGTWYKWLKAGRVPAGRQLGLNTVAWPIEVVLALGQPTTAGVTQSSAGADPSTGIQRSTLTGTRRGGSKRGPAAAPAA